MSKRTVNALVARGVDTETANQLVGQDLTIGALKVKSKDDLLSLGLSDASASRFVAERRDPIPANTVAQVLFANRNCCCVCRAGDAGIILHHIDEYAASKNHSPDNLAVLCLRHHDEVHTKRELSRNLDKKTLRRLKEKWEASVASMDTRAILSLAEADRDLTRFDYINHFRIFEMAQAKQLDLSETPHYGLALSRGLVEANGTPKSPQELGFSNARQRYDFGDGMFLYPYVFEVVKRVLDDTPIINLSDHLDTGWLRQILRIGDIICVQGAHTFKRNANDGSPALDTVVVSRKLKNIEITFSIDLWDATSNSARGVHLAGRQSAMSLATIRSISELGTPLRITCSAIAIGSGFDALKTRDYSPYTGKWFHFENDEDESFEM